MKRMYQILKKKRKKKSKIQIKRIRKSPLMNKKKKIKNNKV